MPTLAAITAGSATIDEATGAGGTTPFIAPPTAVPVIVIAEPRPPRAVPVAQAAAKPSRSAKPSTPAARQERRPESAPVKLRQRVGTRHAPPPRHVPPAPTPPPCPEDEIDWLDVPGRQG